VARREAKRVRDQLARRLGVLHICEQDHHRSPSDPERKVRHGVAEIGLDVFRLHRVERFGDAAQLSRTPLRLDEPGDAVVEGHHSDAISEGLRDPGQHQRGVDRVIQLVEVARRSGHQPTAIERDDHLLSPFGLDLDHDRAVPSGGGGPAYAADVVAPDVVAQARERSRRARRPGAAHPHHGSQPSSQRELDALDGDDVREHRDLLRLRQPDLPAPPSFVTPHLQVDRTEHVSASLW